MSHEEIRPAPQTTDQQETTPQEDRRRRFIERMRAFAENDPQLFATRAADAIESLLTEKIPQARSTEDAQTEGLAAQLIALGGTKAVLEKPNNQFWMKAGSRLRSEGYVAGLTDAFITINEHLTGKSISEALPTQGEPKGQPQQGDITPQK